MDIHSKRMDKVFSELSLKYGIKKDIVKDIVESQFNMVKQTMKKVDSGNNYFPYIRLPSLCCFMVKKGKREFFRNKTLKIVEDVYSQIESGGD